MAGKRGEAVRKATANLARIKERAKGDPAKDPFAAKAQQLKRRQEQGLPLCDPEILAGAMKVNDALEPARKSANQAVLIDE